MKATDLLTYGALAALICVGRLHAAPSPTPAPSNAMGSMSSASPASSPMGSMSGMNMGDDKMMMGKMMPMMMPMMEQMMAMKKNSGANMSAGMPSSSMSSGGGMSMMDDDKMEMSGMMGMSAMGSNASMADSALPGFPGASHLYHIGATGFFLDHPEHISLTTDQQVALNKIKDQAMLAKSASDREIEKAEQELGTLTAADQPDASKIEAKVRDIAKMAADQRMAFIRSVGEAAKLLTPEQRKILTGFMPAAPAAGSGMSMPAASPSPMAMDHM